MYFLRLKRHLEKILTRKNILTNELQKLVKKNIEEVKFTYNEVYYLDCEVDENTGFINKNKQVEHYTKEQVTRNMKAQKSAYLIAKAAVNPIEIVSFRKKYDIAASVLSLILGFSKNTISNIENEGVTSLPSGRFIKVCINNKILLSEYVKTCSNIEVQKKNEILERLTS